MNDENLARNGAQADGMLKVHGLLSIIFGGVGIVAGVTVIILVGFGNTISGTDQSSIFGFTVTTMMISIFWILPHLYLIFAGSFLLVGLKPSAVKVLVIINLIIGIFLNLVLLVLAIINLRQLSDYQRAYLARESNT
jgi:hypothetical protein